MLSEIARGRYLLCDWDAPNAEAVNEIVKKVLGEPPADGAVVVKRIL